MLARKVYDLKDQLEKPEVKILDSNEKQQEFLGKMELRTTASLRDSIEDLILELSSSTKDLRDGDAAGDPLAGDEDNSGNTDDGKGGDDSSSDDDGTAQIDDSQVSRMEALLPG